MSLGSAGASISSVSDPRTSRKHHTSLSRGAVLADVTRLTAFVAGLARSIQRAAVGSSAVAGDVALVT
jgi:hypothetical protein